MDASSRLLLEKSMKGSFILTVKTDGPCVGEFSLVEMSLVNIYNRGMMFTAQIRPEVETYDPRFLKSVGMTREECHAFSPAKDVFPRLGRWLRNQTRNLGVERPEIWSEDPAFQAQWLHYYSYMFLRDEPLGLTYRSIPDFVAGANHAFDDISLVHNGHSINFPEQKLPSEVRAKAMAKMMETIFIKLRSTL